MSLQYFSESSSPVYIQKSSQNSILFYSAYDQVLSDDVFDTQIRLRIPFGCFGLLFSSKYQIKNTLGVIDSDYRGNIKLLLTNKRKTCSEENINFKKDELICNVMITRYSHHPNLPPPSTIYSAGYDLTPSKFDVETNTFYLEKSITPQEGTYALVLPRSSAGIKGFRGVSMFLNTFSSFKLVNTTGGPIPEGRLAQVIFIKFNEGQRLYIEEGMSIVGYSSDFELVKIEDEEEFKSLDEKEGLFLDRTGGFGSTG